jgi:hypothetical protein
MKIALTITPDYLPNWGLLEGIRELVQNGRDAEVEHGAKLEIRHRKSQPGTLVIENDGCVLPHEALLLGHSSKRGRDDMIGHFGEGLKLGVLALVRAGVQVKIRSGSEVWTPSIENHPAFESKVLTFDIQGGREDKRRVSVEVIGISRDAWHSIRPMFLFLNPPSDDKKVQTEYGDVLLDPKMAGKVFVRGILVQTVAGYCWGYNLSNVEIDRDRKMVDSFDLQYCLNNLWRSAVRTREDLIDSYMRMLDGQASDLEGLNNYNASSLPESLRKRCVEQFKKRHGEQAMPVENLEQAADIEHLGARGVVCPKALLAVLQAELGNLDTMRQKLADMPAKQYSWSELSSAERGNLKRALDAVNPHEPVDLSTVDVCDFRRDDIRGLYRDGRKMLAKKILADRSLTLQVLVHEVSHKYGADGEKGHVAKIESLWAAIVEAAS